MFFSCFYHFACKDAKIHQNLEKSNFPRVFYIFSTFFIFLSFCLQGAKIHQNLENSVKNSRKIRFFQFLMNCSILASKMIKKKSKKNLKKKIKKM